MIEKIVTECYVIHFKDIDSKVYNVKLTKEQLEKLYNELVELFDTTKPVSGSLVDEINKALEESEDNAPCDLPPVFAYIPKDDPPF